MKFEKLRARVLDEKIVFRGNVESGNKPERKSLVRGRDFTSTKIKKIEYDESERKKEIKMENKMLFVTDVDIWKIREGGTSG